jgi:hypothetical protein
MNNEELIKENELLKERIKCLETELQHTKEHLKRYTAPAYKKEYYENNKEEILKKHKEYKPTEEQTKKWARTAYLKKKEKIEKEKMLNKLI